MIAAKKCFGLFGLLLLALPIDVVGLQTPPIPDEWEKAPSHSLDVSLKNISPLHSPTSYSMATAEGPALVAGSPNRLVMAVRNETGSTIRFDTVAKTCSCVAITAERNFIEPGESLPFVVRLGPQSSQNSDRYMVSFSLRKDGVDRATILVSGPLQGVLFIDSRSTYESNGKISEWRIPIRTTAPVDPSALIPTLDPALRDFIAKVEVENDRAVLVVGASESQLGQTGITGEVTVQCPTNEVKHSRTITFLKAEFVNLSPKFVRFQRLQSAGDGDNDQEPESYEANFLVRLKDQGEEMPTIQCEAEGWDVNVTAKELANGVLAAHVNIRRASNGEKPSGKHVKIQWNFASKSEAVQITSIGLLED